MAEKKLRTEGVARLLHLPCEAVRTMARCKEVPWAVYIKPKRQRFGRGYYVYYEQALAQAAGLTMEQIEAVMT